MRITTAGLVAKVQGRHHISDSPKLASANRELNRSLLKRKNGNGHTKALADAERKEGRRAKRIGPRSADGDPERLRGLPLHTSNAMGGAILGTRPGDSGFGAAKRATELPRKKRR